MVPMLLVRSSRIVSTVAFAIRILQIGRDGFVDGWHLHQRYKRFVDG
jgi:hypothetical protein